MWYDVIAERVPPWCAVSRVGGSSRAFSLIIAVVKQPRRRSDAVHVLQHLHQLNIIVIVVHALQHGKRGIHLPLAEILPYGIKVPSFPLCCRAMATVRDNANVQATGQQVWQDVALKFDATPAYVAGCMASYFGAFSSNDQINHCFYLLLRINKSHNERKCKPRALNLYL